MTDYFSNIYKLYFIQIARWAMFYMPIFVLFLQDNGLTLNQILILQAIFSISILLFEIPSGYISDKLGEKKTLILGSILSIIGVVFYLQTQSFIGFLSAEIFLGIGVSFISGADSSLIYETLKLTSQESKYKKIESNIQALSAFAESAASIVGGLIAIHFSLKATFIPYLILLIISFFIALTIKQPIKTKKQTITQNHLIKDLYYIISHSLYKNKQISSLILYSGLINTSTLIMVFLSQPYLIETGVSLKYFGYIWAFLNFSIVIFSQFINSYENKLGKKYATYSLIFYPILCFFLLSTFNNQYTWLFILLCYFTRSISTPVIKDYVNTYITSDYRATILSIKNLASRFLFSILAPIIGYLTNNYSLNQTLFYTGIFFFCTSILSLYYLNKHNTIQ